MATNSGTRSNEGVGNAPQFEVFEIVRNGTVLHTFTLPKRQTIEIRRPLTIEDCRKINKCYCVKSPFFTQRIKEFIDIHGEEGLRKAMNTHLVGTLYEKGTLEWYVNIFYGSRRKRDKFLDTLMDYEDAHRPTAEMASQGEESVEKDENTTFSNQRMVAQDQGYVTGQISTSLQNLTMQEDEWHVRNIMAKPLIFHVQNWSTSQAENTVLKKLYIPGDIMTGPHKNIARTFTYFRPQSTELTFTMNGNKFLKGRLMIVFIPMDTFGGVGDPLWTSSQLTSCPHVMLDASESNSGRITIPFVHMRSYFNTNSPRALQLQGLLHLIVFNRLGTTSSASPNVEVTCWVSFKDCEMHQPCPDHDLELSHTMTVHAEMAGIEGTLKSTLDTLLPGTSHILPTITNTLGNVLGGTSNCDKPTKTSELVRWVPNAVSEVNYGDGTDQCTRLSLQHNSYTLGDADIISTTRDDMNMKTVLSIPTRLIKTECTTQQPSGTLITSFPVYPTTCKSMYTDETVDPPVDVYEPTLLAYVSRIAKYWRGGLEYTVQFVASVMNSGRFLIAYSSGHDINGINEAMNMNTLIVDLQEKHEIKFIVPYMNDRPWMRADKMLELPRNSETDRQWVSTGRLYIYVLNRLTSPDSSDQAIDINIFVNAAPDFELAFPTDLSYYKGSGVPVHYQRARAEMQGQEVVTTRTDSSSMVISKGGSMITKGASSTMGENMMELKTLLRRYTKVFFYTGKISTQSYMSFPVMPGLSSITGPYADGTGLQFRTLLAHFNELYTFWRGSLRFTGMIHTSDATSPVDMRIYLLPGVFEVPGGFTFQTVHENYELVMGAIETNGVLLFQSDRQSSFQIETPFYTTYTQLNTMTPDIPTALESVGTVIMLFNAHKEQEVKVTLYQAAGDDFAFNFIRAPPRVQFTKGKEYNRQVYDNALWLYRGEYPNAEMFSGIRETATAAWSLPLQTKNTLKAVEDTTTAVGNAVKKLTGGATSTGSSTSTEPEGESTDEPDGSNLISMALNALAGCLSGLPSSVGLTSSICDWTVSISNLVSGFNSFLQASSLVVKTCALITIVSELFGSAINFVKSKLYSIASHILTFLDGRKQGNQRPSAEMEFLNFVPVLLATVGCGALALGAKSIPDTKETMDLVKTMNEKLRLFNQTSLAMNNIKAIWNQIKNLTETAMDWILMRCAPEILARLKLQRGFEEIEPWATEIDELYETDYVDRSNLDYEYRNKILRLGEVGMKLNKLLVTGKIGKEASVVRAYAAKALEMKAKVEQSFKSLPFRIDPFSVCFEGDPGVGKSTLTNEVAYTIMNAMDYPTEKRWITINAQDQFFNEKYDNHHAIYIDDISAFNNEQQYQNFFTLKSNNQLPLNMAFNKGKCFTSEFIFMTTNTPYPRPNCLNTPLALWRRRDVLIQVRRNPDVPGNERRPDWSHLQFRFRHTTEPGRFESQFMDFDTMQETLIARAIAYLNNQKQVVARQLEHAGYPVPPGMFDIAPEIQQDIELDRELLTEHDLLSLYMEFFDADCLNWSSATRSYRLKPEATEAQKRDWTFINEWYEVMERNLQRDLFSCSRHKRVGFRESVKLALTSRLTSFKEYMDKIWHELCISFPAINYWQAWPAKLAVALIVVGSFGALTTVAVAGTARGICKAVHKCICRVQRNFGYRCAICGKWPNIEKCIDKEWLLDEWKYLYGLEPYKNDETTTEEEEQTFYTCSGTTPPHQGNWIGTKAKREAEMSPYSNDTKGARTVRVLANASPYSQDTKGLKTTRIMAENGMTEQVLENRVVPYTYRIKCVDGGICSMNAFAIGDRWIMLPKHFYDATRSREWQIYHSNAWMKLRWDPTRVKEFPNKDCILYDMPLQFHQHKDMRKHFITERDLTHLKKTTGYLVTQMNEGTTILRRLEEITGVRKIEYDATYEDEIRTYVVQESWKYPHPRSEGACGSILVTDSKQTEGSLLGFHIAGNGMYGWSQLITREMMDVTMKHRLGTPLPVVIDDKMTLTPEGHFGLCGRVKQGVYQSKKTSIIPTAIHGIVRAPVTAPAVLRQEDPRLKTPTNVMKKAIEKYGSPPLEFPKEHLDMVYESLETEIGKWTRQRDPEVLTLTESVLGIPTLDGYDRLPMNTSPGYPYVLKRPHGTIGKSYMFDEEGNVIDPDLNSSYLQRLGLAKKGERCISVWTCCLKDERRPMKKVEEGSTRLFTIPPVDLSLVTRQYTLDFSIAIKDNRHTSFTKVGIDPQSLEWTHLYEWLAEFSPLVVAGDFTRYDGTIPPDVSFKFYEHIDSYYKRFGKWSEEDRNVRLTLADEGVHTVHIVGDNIFVNHTGNESGDPNTVNKNSFVNYYYLALTWLGIMKEQKPEWMNMASFRQHVRPAVYGDDNLIAIKREAIELYNQITIAKYLKKYEITYTNSEKTGLTKWQRLDSATFLKNGFGQHESMSAVKVPLMNEDTIYELLNWTREAPDQDELLESNCNDSLRFAYFYGYDYFNGLRTKILSALKQVGKTQMDIMTYSDYHYWFLWVTGRLQRTAQSEAFFEKVASQGNGQLARLVNKTLMYVPYKLLSLTGVLRKGQKTEPTDDRHAIAIPSGEGKSWLCRNYPHLFVDHDELLLPAARHALKEEGISIKAFHKIFDLEFPESDRRVLLCHHPDNTKRQVMGCFKLPKPAWIRANAIQRAMMKNAKTMERDERNQEILRLTQQYEPQLFTTN